ncbi:MAG: hypothetical protein NC320_01610 [Clostridium sp.]|nr:hypothetical protein [Clostridium sp.]
MLVPAILYKSEIIARFQQKFYTEDMLFETASLHNWIPNIADEQDENDYQFAIIDENEKLIGYLGYYIDWYGSCASQFGLMSFDKGNPIVVIDVYKTIRKLIYEYKLHRIEWRMVGGNPVERHYDKICNRFGGTKHILRDAIKDHNGNYHDNIIYEIIMKNS